MDTFVAKMDFPDFFLVFPWNAWLALLKKTVWKIWGQWITRLVSSLMILQ